MNNSEKVNKYLNSSNIQELTNKNIEDWYLANRVGMIKHMPEILGKYEIKEQIISMEDVKLKKINLFEHQKFVRDYLQSKSPYRGLLLYHSLGSGKSLTAIATSELLLKEREVIVILPAYLKNNFIEEVKKYGNKFYTKEQHWEFIELKNINIENIANIKRISEELIRKNKGIWISNSKKKSNYSSLTQDNQNQINKQINDIIEKRYRFIHLDGLRKNHIKDFKDNPDQFENKLIIIDEVHNFISQVIGGGIAKALYEILLTRNTSKFICLSGSPMVNYPEEIAYLVNLLKGYEKVYIFKKIPRSIVNGDELKKVLSQEKKLDFYEYDEINELLKMKLLPTGFSKTKNERVKYDNELFSNDKVIKDILAVLKKNKMLFNGKYKTTKFLALPLNRNEFINLFVDQGKLTIKNPNLFRRRILGAISYYTASGTKDIYPTLNETKLELLTFKDEQFKRYLDARIKERKSESSKQGIFSQNEQVYKSYSRALCNFVFPKEIPRPYPSDAKYSDNNEFNFLEENTGTKTSKFDKLLNNSLNKLISGNYLDEDNLINYSPKFDKIYKNILQTIGTALVYSSFRTVEGVFLFTKVLDKRGYAEFKVKKNKTTGNWSIDVTEEDRLKPKYMVFTSDKEQNNLLLKIFNSEVEDIPTNIRNELSNYDTMNTNDNNLHGSIIKIIMITRSGSEGISLKNVRQVHLIEPYWNQVRLDQVIGRAVRANSHKDLPKSERFVDVFKYIMKFTDEQIKNDFTIRKKDHSLTTDQVIDNISFKKMKIISKLQQLMKESSVDCLIHHKTNPDLQCFTFPINLNDKDIIVKPDIHDDDLNSNVEKIEQVRKLNLKKVLILTKPFMIDLNTSELFDFNLWKNNGTIKMIGFLEKIDEDNYRLTVIKKYIKNVI